VVEHPQGSSSHGLSAVEAEDIGAIDSQRILPKGKDAFALGLGRDLLFLRGISTSRLREVLGRHLIAYRSLNT
jgi:hypothetical protein